MKAFRYNDAANGLELEEYPVPDCGPDDVLIKVRAAGLCHTDCHILTGANDGWIYKKPITLGHEVAGKVVKTGANVSEFVAGNRVCVYQLCQPYEILDWSTSIGIGFDGGYAEYATAPVSRIKHVPDNVSFAQAAVAMDALATSYQAVMIRGGAKKGSKVGIIGIGGLGMAAVEFAAIEGAEVHGIDLDVSKFERAKTLGAKNCFKSLDEAEGLKFDVIVDFVGISKTVEAGVSSVRLGGTVVVVGLSSKSVSVPLEKFIFNGAVLVGSLGASVETTDRVLELLQKGAIRPALIEVPFKDIPSTLNRLHEGEQAEGRFWADPGKA